MNNRIKQLRNAMGLTQQQFADRLKLKRNTVATYEGGRSTPSDAAISLMCQEFNVNELWLRTGEGDMLCPVSRRNELTDIVDRILRDEPDSFKIRLVSTLLRLDDKEWAVLEKIATRIVKEQPPVVETRSQREARLLREEADAVERGGEKLSASPLRKNA